MAGRIHEFNWVRQSELDKGGQSSWRTADNNNVAGYVLPRLSDKGFVRESKQDISSASNNLSTARSRLDERQITDLYQRWRGGGG
jgi:hypothetical protein